MGNAAACGDVLQLRLSKVSSLIPAIFWSSSTTSPLLFSLSLIVNLSLHATRNTIFTCRFQGVYYLARIIYVSRTRFCSRTLTLFLWCMRVGLRMKPPEVKAVSYLSGWGSGKALGYVQGDMP
ncbi:hypothetical protein SODALDRAFT_91748 [Sodiomyces alkalinus F11]|uniref:Uncharacterized protein n=1 Tax=Sodiomyces alkalinus (strain CBS 110278 / VKM F-3762 / F11) TaxID=1314773 RepID=A0A3N2Q0F6_SODAK|nr:hypothetical protein SODALDRAFT_91748 [Sodiomyces alkalinus F11]ROT40243.1 hypothetical protein SODALDRAFT_91748 [Sodiomyces alkalinus F11]